MLDTVDIEESPDAVILLNPNFEIINLNSKAAQYFNKPQNELVGHSVFQPLDLKSYALKRALVRARKAFRSLVPDIPQSFEWIEQNNGQILRALTVAIYKNTQNKHSCYILSFKDIRLNKISLALYNQIENNRRTEKLEESNLEQDLVNAIRKDELFFCFQPFFKMADASIAGVEGFLRWQHPSKGVLYPAEFIFLAEETHIINMLGQWGIEQAFEDFTQVLKQIDNARLTLNISLLQIDDPRFLDMLLDRLGQYGLSPNHIILDICEYTIKTLEGHIINTIQSLEDHGFHISLDNFGSNPVHMSLLSLIPCDFVKLNKKFIEDIYKNPKQQAMLKSIIDMAHSLHIDTFQEFVEHPHQHEVLKRLGCDFVQGNYYSKAMNMDEFISFAKDFKKKKSF